MRMISSMPDRSCSGNLDAVPMQQGDGNGLFTPVDFFEVLRHVQNRTAEHCAPTVDSNGLGYRESTQLCKHCANLQERRKR